MASTPETQSASLPVQLAVPAPTPGGAKAGISSRKAFVIAVAAFLVNAAISFLNVGQAPWLDLTIRSASLGLLLGVANYLKHASQ